MHKQINPKNQISDAALRLASGHIKGTLRLLKQDTEREGLQDTPLRHAKFYNGFLNPEPFKFTTFKNEGTDQMIIVKDIPFYSLCEHHLVPFFGTGAIAYIPTKKLAGLSKFPRVLDYFARNLQNQERITKQVADFLMEELRPKGVAVMIEARHLCVEMRGIRKPGTQTVTSCLLGEFKKQEVRSEFFTLIK